MKEITFESLYEEQKLNQLAIAARGMYDNYRRTEITELPADDPGVMSYNVLHLVSEIGELLSADKRWKSLRKGEPQKTEKLDELADIYIFLLNIAYFSGFTCDELKEAVAAKIAKVTNRVREEKI